MSRVWKPGDVAIWHGSSDPYVAFAVPICASDHEDGWHWHLSNGGWASRDTRHIRRPVVVIDPEDRAQVDRLSALARASDNMQTALRELADPTPPRCGAVLNLAGKHYRCDEAVGHDEPHANFDAQAIWGESK